MSLKGSCHCRAIQFEVEAAPKSVTSCTCSICSRLGAMWAYYPAAQFKLTTARDRVSTYQWGHYVMQFHHCGVCGSMVYNEGPSWKDNAPDHDNPRVSINARMLQDFDLAAVPVRHVDGRNDW